MTAAPTLNPANAISAPSGEEIRSPLRWAARGVLVLLGLPKTIAFNLRYLPLRQAVRLPILVSHRMAIFNFGGSVTVADPVRPGMVLLGFGANGAFDFRRSRSVWQVAGEVVFRGAARLGNGFKLSIQRGGGVTFGPGFVLSAESQIVCRERITFGEDCLISWEVLLLDSDFHPIAAGNGNRPAIQAPVVLGDRVWVGARSTVLKGVKLGNDVVVAAGSVVTGGLVASDALVGGNPAQVLRSGVRWHR